MGQRMGPSKPWSVKMIFHLQDELCIKSNTFNALSLQLVHFSEPDPSFSFPHWIPRFILSIEHSYLNGTNVYQLRDRYSDLLLQAFNSSLVQPQFYCQLICKYANGEINYNLPSLKRWASLKHKVL